MVPVISDSPRSATRHFALAPENLFRLNDPESLAERIDYWLDNPEAREEASEAYLCYKNKIDQGGCMDAMEEMILRNAEAVR